MKPHIYKRRGRWHVSDPPKDWLLESLENGSRDDAYKFWRRYDQATDRCKEWNYFG